MFISRHIYELYKYKYIYIYVCVCGLMLRAQARYERCLDVILDLFRLLGALVLRLPLGVVLAECHSYRNNNNNSNNNNNNSNNNNSNNFNDTKEKT